MYKTIVVDDELYARKRVIELLSKRQEFEVSAECSNGKEAIEYINSIKPDLIILDIELKDMNGFDILRNLKKENKFNVIFVTAYDQYAIKAFDNFALDFLLKPFKDERFNESLDRVLEKLKIKKFENNVEELLRQYYALQNNTHPISKNIPIRQGNKTVLLDLNSIKYIIASSYYSEIYYDNKKLVLRESLKNLIKKLNNSIFIRVHRSTIINTNYINELIHSDYNELDIKMMDNNIFRVSKSYRKEFLEKIGV